MMLNGLRLRTSTTVVAAVLLAGCEFDQTVSGPMRDEPVSVDAKGADRANIELDMGAGEMMLRSGARTLLQGRFEYNIPEWKPRVEESISGSHAIVTIRQARNVHPGGNKRYIWDLELNDKVLLDLALHFGAGRARLELGDLDLRTVSIQMGAGQVDLDLRGHPSRDYDVDMSGGVGQATVRLPEGVGIRAEAHGGLGSIEVTGLDKRGDHYENALYDHAKVNVRLKVEGGIGQIRIIG